MSESCNDSKKSTEEAAKHQNTPVQFHGELITRRKALEMKLRTKLTEAEMVEVTAFTDHAHDAMFREMRERQQRKYDQLSRKRQQTGHSVHSGQRDDPDNITERWVINLADRQLDNSEISLFKKGLNCAVTIQSLRVDDLITATEMACRTSTKTQGRRVEE